MVKRNILGIDIGTSYVKVLAGTVDENENVVVIGAGSVPAEGVSQGNIIDVQALAKAVKQAVDCVNIVTRCSYERTYIGISGLEVSAIFGTGSVATKKAGKINRKDIERACQASAFSLINDDRQILHISPICFWVDGQKQNDLPLDRYGTSLKVDTHIVTGAKTKITEIIAALEESGLPITGVIVNYIVSQAVIQQNERTQYLFMDMGAGTTDVVLHHQGHISISASLPLGGEYITGDISQGLVVSRVHAEEIKRYYARLDENLYGQGIVLDCNDYGTTDKHIPYDFLHVIIESRVDEIVGIVYDYLASALLGQSITKIFFTGGCALMPSIIRSIEKRFGVPVEILLPSTLPKEYANPSNTACLGILHYAVTQLPVKVDESNVWGEFFWKKMRNILDF